MNQIGLLSYRIRRFKAPGVPDPLVALKPDVLGKSGEMLGCFSSGRVTDKWHVRILGPEYTKVDTIPFEYDTTFADRRYHFGVGLQKYSPWVPACRNFCVIRRVTRQIDRPLASTPPLFDVCTPRLTRGQEVTRTIAASGTD